MTQALGANQNQNYGYYETSQSFGRVTNAFVGWFSDEQHPTLPIQVNGKTANGEEVNLLFVHLPPPGNAAKHIADETNPFHQSAIVNLLEEQGPGIPKSGGIFR